MSDRQRIPKRVYGALKALYLLPVRLYRRFISPYKPAGTCRFHPTCSQYAIDAVGEWGILIGTLLAVWRVARCNPFCRGGEDPVPRREDVWRTIRLWLMRTFRRP